MGNAEWTGTEELYENELRDRAELLECVQWHGAPVPTSVVEWARGLGDVSVLDGLVAA
jgi:hypothetical protein